MLDHCTKTVFHWTYIHLFSPFQSAVSKQIKDALKILCCKSEKKFFHHVITANHNNGRGWNRKRNVRINNRDNDIYCYLYWINPAQPVQYKLNQKKIWILLLMDSLGLVYFLYAFQKAINQARIHLKSLPFK